MHTIERDNVMREPFERVQFNKKCDQLHWLAQWLEEHGYKTFGQNDHMYAHIPVGKYVYGAYPKWKSDDDHSEIHLTIPSLSNEVIKIKTESFTKAFSPDSFLTNTILNYANAIADYNIKVEPFKKSLHSAEQAFLNNIELAMTLDGIEDAQS
jgi:hypothetical protein